MSNNKFKVLVVEDEANICSFIYTLLETNGYQTFVAPSCELGQSMFGSCNPDLIILDLGLPDRDGVELIRYMRQKYLTPNIVLSARTTERDKIQAEQVQNNMSMQLAQAVRQIDAMRESQDLASRYRHDLRHHLQYVLNCIENDQEDEAKKYISTICEEIEAQRVQRYCENDAVNLILSAFVGRAKKAGVTMQVLGYLSDFILASDSDLCVLLSNALENALHACAPLVEAGQDCVIDVNFHERGKKFFLQITNPCQQEKVRLVKGIPVTDQPGHGLGVQSICSVVAKYGGLYDFSVQDGTFILRLSL